MDFNGLTVHYEETIVRLNPLRTCFQSIALVIKQNLIGCDASIVQLRPHRDKNQWITMDHQE